MRYRSKEAAPRSRVPFTLWGPKPARMAMSAVAAAAIGLVPALAVSAPAQAAPSSGGLTITAAGSVYEGSAVTFNYSYTGSGGTYTIATAPTTNPSGNATPGGSYDYSATPSTVSLVVTDGSSVAQTGTI